MGENTFIKIIIIILNTRIFCQRLRGPYHGKVEDSSNRAQSTSFSDQMLRPFQGTDITGGYKDLDAHGLPLPNTLRLVTCSKDIDVLPIRLRKELRQVQVSEKALNQLAFI